MGDILSGSELLLNLFSVFRVSRAAQILVLEFSKYLLADLGDKPTDGGLANQSVILQGRVGLSCCLSGIASFNPTSKGFLKLVTDFLMRRWYAFFDELKKAGAILTKFWYPGILVCFRSARRLL